MRLGAVRVSGRAFLEESDQLPDGVMAVLGMTQRKLVVYLVPVTPTVASLRQVSRPLQVVDDVGDGSFGDTDGHGDVSEPRARVVGNALEHVGVVGHEPPSVIAFP